MDRETARQEIRRAWRSIMPTISSPAKQNVNGETSWICPLCGHGAHGDGLTRNPQSADGSGLKCFGCGFSGDIIDLYQRTTGSDHNTALYTLAAQVGIDLAQGAQDAMFNASKAPAGTKTAPAAKAPQEATSGPTEGGSFEAYYQQCQNRISLDFIPFDESDSAGIKYLESRGISIETAQAHGIGFDPAWKHPKAPSAVPASPRLIIPISNYNYLARDTREQLTEQEAAYKKSKVKSKEGLSWIFNPGALYAQDAQEVFITEGEIDALSIAEAGGNAAAIGSANYTEAFIKQLEQRKPTAPVMFLCLDNDPEKDGQTPAGERATAILKEAAERLKIPAIDLRPMIKGKDPNEALQHDPAGFRQAIAEAKQTAADIADSLQEMAQREELERQQRTGPVMVDLFLEAIQTRKYEPIPTGITDIDRALGGGFMRQWLVLLGAPPGAGKTALAQWLFEGMAKRGTTCLYLNLEMSREQMLARSISRIAAQNGDKIKPVEVLQGYKWTAEQQEAVTIAAAEYRRDIAPHLIYNPDSVTSSLDSIMEYIEAEATRAEAAGLPAPILVLDYLQVLTGGQREDKIDLIQRAITSLKGYAIEHNTLVFAIMANNRESNRTGVTSMESGRDTSNIEYGADLLLGLDFTKCLPRNGEKGKSKDDLTPEDMNYKTLKINKGRFSAPGAQVDLFFNGETMTFSQLAPEFYEEPAKPRYVIAEKVK